MYKNRLGLGFNILDITMLAVADYKCLYSEDSVYYHYIFKIGKLWEIEDFRAEFKRKNKSLYYAISNIIKNKEENTIYLCVNEDMHNKLELYLIDDYTF